MPILGVDVNAIPEREHVSAGQYEVRITSLKYLDDENEVIKSKDTGRKMMKGSLKILSETAPTVFFNLMENIKGDSADYIEMNQENIANFFRCFSLDTELDEAGLCETAPGAEGSVKLKLTISTEFGDKNEVDRFIAA